MMHCPRQICLLYQKGLSRRTEWGGMAFGYVFHWAYLNPFKYKYWNERILKILFIILRLFLLILATAYDDLQLLGATLNFSELL